MDNYRNLTFSINILWDRKSGCQVDLGNHGSLKIDALPEFGGGGKQPCSDELFLAAIGGCLLSTFLYMGRKLRLRLLDLRISVGGELRLNGSEGYRLTTINAIIYVKTLKRQEARAKECVRLTRSFCHITRLIEETVPVGLSANIDCIEDGNHIFH